MQAAREAAEIGFRYLFSSQQTDKIVGHPADECE